MFDGAEVQVCKVYYLLCSQYLNQNYPSIEVRKLCEKKMSSGTWYIYEVQATALKKDAAWFLEFSLQANRNSYFFTAGLTNICESTICNQQLVSAGRPKALQHTYLWKEMMDEITSVPVIEVTDKKENRIGNGVQYSLPESGLLSISSPFDESVIVLKNGIIFDKRHIKGRGSLELDNIHVGVEI